MITRNLTIATVAAMALSLTACAGTSTNQNAFDQAVDPQPTTSQTESAAPKLADEAFGIINTIDLPKKTVQVGEIVEIKFTPAQGEKAGTSSLIENIDMLELNPEKSDPANGTLSFTAIKAGETKVTVIGADADGGIQGQWSGYDLTIVE